MNTPHFMRGDSALPWEARPTTRRTSRPDMVDVRDAKGRIVANYFDGDVGRALAALPALVEASRSLLLVARSVDGECYLTPEQEDALTEAAEAVDAALVAITNDPAFALRRADGSLPPHLSYADGPAPETAEDSLPF